MPIQIKKQFLVQALIFSFLSVAKAQGTNLTEPSVDDAAVATADAENLCSISKESLESFSTPWHIGGLFIVLVVSALGIIASLFLGMAYQSKEKYFLVQQVLQLTKMFGIGVIAATAWIHLLPEAFGMFGNPCIDPWWAIYGTNWVGIFALAAAFMVQLIELAGHSHVSPIDVPPSDAHISISVEQNLRSTHEDDQATLGYNARKNKLAADDEATLGYNARKNKLAADDEAALPVTILKIPANDMEYHNSPDMKRISIIVLEAGILTHSVIIGLTLGVASDSTFDALLIAVCFHQLFEGLALGSLVSDTNLSNVSKVVMALLYPLSTPIGIGIGIGVHSVYSENQPSLILIQGILESLSSGILIYSTYCELVGGEINHNAAFARYPRKFKVICFLAMYLGAAAMAIIGYWA